MLIPIAGQPLTPDSDPTFAKVYLTDAILENNQAATKAYVDATSQGLIPHANCLVATEQEIVGTYNNGTSGVGASITYTASGRISIDGVQLSQNDRVLVKNQTISSQNGIYYVSVQGSPTESGVLVRATDYDSTSEMLQGASTTIQSGATNARTQWFQSSADVQIVGTDSVEFSDYGLQQGTMASQNENNVDISGGVVSGVTRTGSRGTFSSIGITDGTYEIPYFINIEDSGVCFFNNNASADIYAQLPPTAAGAEFYFEVSNLGHSFFLITDFTSTFSGDINGVGISSLSSNQTGAFLVLKSVGFNTWATAVYGEWVSDTGVTFKGSYEFGVPSSLGLDSMATKASDNYIGDIALSNDSDHAFYVKPSEDGNGGYNFDIIAGDGTGTNQAGGKLRLKSGRSTGIRFSSVEIWANPGSATPGNTPVDDVLVAQFLAGLSQVYYSVGSNINPNAIKGTAYFASGEPLKGGLLLSPTANTGNFNTVITNHPLGQTTNFRHPDPGVTFVDYVLSEGDQTINGQKTFSNVDVTGGAGVFDAGIRGKSFFNQITGHISPEAALELTAADTGNVYENNDADHDTYFKLPDTPPIGTRFEFVESTENGYSIYVLTQGSNRILVNGTAVESLKSNQNGSRLFLEYSDYNVWSIFLSGVWTVDQHVFVGVVDASNVTNASLNGCYSTIVSLAQDTTVIDVSGKSIFKTNANTVATEITNLSNGIPGQEVIIFGGSDIIPSVINNGGNFSLKTSSWTANENKGVKLFYTGAIWVEI